MLTAQNMNLEPSPARLETRDIVARFMLPDLTEHTARVADLTINGANFLTDKIPHIGVSIVAYIGELGRIEAVAGASIDGGFSIQFSLTGPRLERLQLRIKTMLDANMGIGTAKRRHVRIMPNETMSHIKLPDGRIYPCEVLDISISSAAIKTEVMPSLGTFLMLGRMKGRVIRYLDNGVAIEFVKQLDSYEMQNVDDELKG